MAHRSGPAARFELVVNALPMGHFPASAEERDLRRLEKSSRASPIGHAGTSDVVHSDRGESHGNVSAGPPPAALKAYWTPLGSSDRVDGLDRQPASYTRRGRVSTASSISSRKGDCRRL